MQITSFRFQSQVGYIRLYFEDSFLIGLDFEGSAESGTRIVGQLSRFLPMEQCREQETPAARQVQDWLENYFSGSAEPFTLPMKLYGTEFQQRVWQELLCLQRGEVLSYAQLAQRVQCNGVRAVGTAVGKNTIPIIVPCHRIVRQDGVIGKFGAGNGTESKRLLLQLEGVTRWNSKK